MTARATLDHLVLLASHIESSAQFYDRVLTTLGFRKTRDWAWLNDHGIAIDLQPAQPGAPYRRSGPGLNHLGFAVPSRAALDAICANLSAAGLPLPELQHINGAHCLFLPDPDGLRVEIAWEGEDKATTA